MRHAINCGVTKTVEEHMQLLWAIVIGFVVGLIARFLKPGRDAMGFITTTVLGVIGSLLATFTGRAMGFYTANEPAGFLASVLGAVVVLAIWAGVSGRSGSSIRSADRDRWAA
jgi:uncharacterized membrane protein YeaQ/YmgE (transglycosylase-associated protein family)